MLEEARELMIKFIEVYGFNDEVTIASSVLVDKILNKEGEKNVKCSRYCLQSYNLYQR